MNKVLQFVSDDQWQVLSVVEHVLSIIGSRDLYMLILRPRRLELSLRWINL